MATTKTTSLTLTLGYTNTDFTRKLRIDNFDTGQAPYLRQRIRALNASLSGGTDDGLADFFVSDDYDASDANNVVGTLRAITAVQYDEVTAVDIEMS